MPLLSNKLLASKARGTSWHQDGLLIAWKFPEEIIDVHILKEGSIVMVTKDAIMRVGRLSNEWMPLQCLGLRVVKWWVTGGRPSGTASSRHGILLNYLGLNFHATIGEHDHLPLRHHGTLQAQGASSVLVGEQNDREP